MLKIISNQKLKFPENHLVKGIACSVFLMAILLVGNRTAWSFPLAVKLPDIVFDSPNYMLQLNAYLDKANATKFIKKLNKKGYSAFVFTSKKERTWYKIMMGPFKSRSRAMSQVEELNEKEKIKAILFTSDHIPAKKKPAKAMKSTRPRPVKVAPASFTKLQPEVSSEDDDESISPLSHATVGKPNDTVEVIISMLLAWKKAWQSQRVEQYLGFYSRTFSHKASSYGEWEKARRLALTKNHNINIEMSDIRILEGTDTIQISFTQKYESDGFSDIGKKTLIWKLENSEWVIVKELWNASS